MVLPVSVALNRPGAVHLLLDDWGIAPLDAMVRNDLREIIDDRAAGKDTIVASQLPIEHWDGWIDDETIADAIDRLMQRHHRIKLTGESLRKHRRSPACWNQNSTKTREEIYNRHRATPDLAESVTFPKSAVTFAEMRNCSVTRGNRARAAVESLLGLPWNQCSAWRGIRTHGVARGFAKGCLR
ncbi:ATP-binding protein [Paraburkholderia phytofirmans]